MSQRRVEMMAVDQLVPATKNPKRHAARELDASLERFGYVEPVVLDERTKRLVAGHGRVDALLARKKAGKEPPAGVAVQGGKWLVPVLRGWKSRTDAEAEAYLVASNRLVEAGGWDDAELARLLRDMPREDFAFTGFSDRELELLMATTGLTAEDAAPDAPPPPAGEVWVQPGQLFRLGEHRIVCGDSTSPEAVAQLLGDDRPNLMVTDPPYGVEYDASWRDEVLVGDAPRAAGPVSNDDRADWTPAWKLFPGNVGYVWHAAWFGGEVAQSLAAAGLTRRSQIIWRKPHFAIGRGAYHWQHEPCWYVVRDGAKANFIGEKNQSTVWDVASISGFGSSGDAADDSAVEGAERHSTQKPVELYRRPLLNHTKTGDYVYEPFSGSGTCIAACEQLERRCLAVELEPRYVQQAIMRWEKLTGGKHEVIK